jgi:hypothetical protein
MAAPVKARKRRHFPDSLILDLIVQGWKRRLVEQLGCSVANWPLSAYRWRSYYNMRTDALDRFGTRLEHRHDPNPNQGNDGKRGVMRHRLLRLRAILVRNRAQNLNAVRVLTMREHCTCIAVR